MTHDIASTVHLPTLEAQEEYYKKHEEEILKSRKRFGVVSSTDYKLYDTIEEVYRDFPNLSPDAPTFFGTLPKLVDIGKETNSLEYRKEKLEIEKEKCQKGLIKLVRKQNELGETEKELLREEKLLRKNIS